MPLKPEPLHQWCQTVDADPESEWLLDGLLQLDAAVQISGQATVTFKTWYAFAVALVVASGKSHSLLTPTVTDGLPVLVVEQEGPRKPTRGRFRLLENGMGVSIAELGDKFQWVHRQQFSLSRKADVLALAKFVKAHDTKLVVLDTFAKVQEASENDAQAISKTMRNIDVVRAVNGCSIMYLHHTGKPVKDFARDIDDETRGSSALAGFYDQHFAFRRQDIDQDWIDLTVRQNDGQQQEYSVQWIIDSNKETARLDMRASTDMSETRKDKLVSLLAGDSTYSMQYLRKAWGLSLKNTHEMVASLMAEGTLMAQKDGRLRLT